MRIFVTVEEEEEEEVVEEDVDEGKEEEEVEVEEEEEEEKEVLEEVEEEEGCRPAEAFSMVEELLALPVPVLPPVDIKSPLSVGVAVLAHPLPQSASDLVVVSMAPRMAIDKGETGDVFFDFYVET